MPRKHDPEYTLVQVARYIGEHGYNPSVRELCDLTGMQSTGGMHYQLRGLQERGLVDWAENKERTLHVTEAGYALIEANEGGNGS